MTPTRRTLLLLAIGLAIAILPAAGLARAWPAIALFWAGAALLLSADALRCPRRGEVTWSIEAPGALHAGGREPLGLRVAIVAARPLPFEAAIGLSDDLAPQPPLRGAAAREPVTLAWELVPSRRGIARLETLWLRWESPLGFWTRWLTVPLERELTVLPDLPRVRAAAIRFFADRDFRAGLRIERYRGEGSEFDSLKEYLPGDDHRAIDWKASARHLTLLARQHRAERDHQVILAVDTGRVMSETLGAITRLDHALNAALLLAYVCLASGDRVGLFGFDARPGAALAPVHGVSGMRALVDAIARVGYSRDETNYTLGLTTLAQRLSRRSLVILLTDFVDTVTAELMIENVARLIERHVLVFVSIRDPRLVALAESRPASEEDLGRAVVAGTLLRDRELVHLRLRRFGVRALDVPPERIAPGLIDQYLDIKRREKV